MRTTRGLPVSVWLPVFIALAVVAAGAFLLSACGFGMPMGAHGGSHMRRGADTSAEPQVVAEGSVTVEIRDYAFQPGNLRVRVGTQVTWANRDGVTHTATADDGAWDTGLLDRGEAATLPFDMPGTYTYRCIPHPNMIARIEVVP